jgi:hypothetical protein
MGKYKVSVLRVSKLRWKEQREIRDADFNVIIQKAKGATQSL